MKKSELRQIIKEELKLVKEDFDTIDYEKCAKLVNLHLSKIGIKVSDINASKIQYAFKKNGQIVKDVNVQLKKPLISFFENMKIRTINVQLTSDNFIKLHIILDYTTTSGAEQARYTAKIKI